MIKNNLNSEGSQVAHTNVTLQDLSPIRFHRVHGNCIKMSDDYCTARLDMSSNKLLLHEHLVFSSRPIAVDEKVFVRLVPNPNKCYSFFIFGLTDCDPNTMISLELPDRHKTVNIYWDTSNNKDFVINFRFCVKASGEVWCSVNDTDMVCLFEKININVPIWAVIKPHRSLVTALKIIDCLNENKTEELKPASLENPSPPTSNVSIELCKTHQKQNMKGDKTKLKPDKKADLDNKTEENEGNESTALKRGCGVTLTNVTMQYLPRLSFHEVHDIDFEMYDGTYTRISANKRYKRYLFSSRPIADGEKVYLRLKTVPMKFLDGLSIGLTTSDPNSINILEFWNFYNLLKGFSNLFKNNTDILYFCVKQRGDVACFLNGDDLNYHFKNFNISGRHWAVLELPHNVINVEFIPSPNGTKSGDYKLLSEEKPLRPITNTLVELNNLTSNISNLKLDSKMFKEKPKSYEAFKPLANIEKIKSPLNAEDGEASPTDCAVDVLNPLRFHRVHGRFVTISDDYCTAQSAIPKEKPFLATHECFAFSSRPVAINEKVYLRIEKASRPYIYTFGFGFTDCDPSILVDLLPKFCPYGDCIFSNCLNNVPFNFGTEGNPFFFFLKPSGEVCYGINDQEIGSVSKVINVNTPLWVLIKLSNCIPTATLIDFPKENMAKDLISPTTTLQTITKKISTNYTENKKTGILKLTAPSRGVLLEKPIFYCSGGAPVRIAPCESLHFHSVHGKYIILSPDKTVASCEMPAREPLFVTHECYVFSSRPIDINEKVHLKLEAVSKKSLNAFSFGFTDCDPCIIPNIMDRLCLTSTCIFGNCLTDLPSQFCVKDNYLHFYVTKAGEVHFMVNEKEKGVFNGGVNISSRIWAVIKVTNLVSSVRLGNKKQASSKLFFSGEISSALKTSLGSKEEQTETSSKNTKSQGGDEKKNIPADSNILTGMPRTDVTSNTKGQTLFDWGVESSVISEPEFKKAESKTERTVQESFKLNIQPSESNTPAKIVQPTSSTDVKYIPKPVDYDAIHFAKIVENQLNRVPEDKRMKCMQEILQVLDKSSK